jgi:hypothetical protein
VSSVKAKIRRGKKTAINREEESTVQAIQELQAFEKFKDEILPNLRRDIAQGLGAEDMLKKYAALAAARGISIALGDKDSSRALGAVKDILDRVQGRATERKEVKHKYDDLPDEELDAILLSEMQDLETMVEKDVEPPKKRRGRPKGSKNKTKKVEVH